MTKKTRPQKYGVENAATKAGRKFRAMQVGPGSGRRNESSAIASVQYTPDEQSRGTPDEVGTLTIVFNRWGYGAYEYYMVPRRTYESLLKSPSMGAFFNYYIRNAYEVGGAA
jgi:hypothetical protein